MTECRVIVLVLIPAIVVMIWSVFSKWENWQRAERAERDLHLMKLWAEKAVKLPAMCARHDPEVSKALKAGECPGCEILSTALPYRIRTRVK